MKTLFIDTNVVLRFLLRDVQKQFQMAKTMFAEGEKRKIVCLPEMIAEVVFVLESVYEMSREEISELMGRFVQTAPVEIRDKEVIVWVMDKYGSVNLGYIDVLVLGYARANDGEVVSFDKKLMKMQKKLQENS